MSLYKVDFALPMWRALFPLLYDKVLRFGLEQGNPEQELKLRLARLLLNDSTVVLLVELEEGNYSSIKAHCLIQLLQEGQIAAVEHMEITPDKSSTFAQDCLDYISKTLTLQYPIGKIVFSTSRHDYRAFQRKYGFTVQSILLTKEIKADG